MADHNIERKIIIGLIASSDYIKQVRDVYNTRLLESSTAKRIGAWCIEYYDKYDKAPGKDIETIYYEKLKKGLPKELAEEIEQDILPGLSEEYIEEGVDLRPLVDQTRFYFSEKHLTLHKQQIETLLDEGKVEEAEQLALNFKGVVKDAGTSVNFGDPRSLEKVEKAFKEAAKPLIYYPKQLGEFWNHQMVRGGFVALMGSEKRGKTFWMMDMAVRAVKQKSRVAFFQAGDMTESQQIRRFCIHLSKTSDMEKYCGEMFQPVRDCVNNQRGVCDKEERECSFGVFDNKTEKQIRKEITIDELKEAYNDNPDYKPCHNCLDYKTRMTGTTWVEKVIIKNPLDAKRATDVWDRFFIRNKHQLVLSTHANGSLSVGQMKSLLSTWEKQSGFVPDVIIVDYADLLVSDTKQDFRHQQNDIWKALRSLSQEKDCLVVTATQADADSYTRDLLSLKNFSEDKRKYAHVTAMYGLNQDPMGREKKIGIMRINEIVIREGDFSNNNVCYVLQNLKRGMPFLGSYF